MYQIKARKLNYLDVSFLSSFKINMASKVVQDFLSTKNKEFSILDVLKDGNKQDNVSDGGLTLTPQDVDAIIAGINDAREKQEISYLEFYRKNSLIFFPPNPTSSNTSKPTSHPIYHQLYEYFTTSSPILAEKLKLRLYSFIAIYDKLDSCYEIMQISDMIEDYISNLEKKSQKENKSVATLINESLLSE